MNPIDNDVPLLSEGDQCPISPDQVGEKTARVVAGLVLMTSVVILAFPSKIAAIILILDFLSRGVLRGTASPFKLIATGIVQSIGIQDNKVNAGPKVFAARMGLAMSILILFCLYKGHPAAARGVTGLLGLCAFLESALGYCVGCTIYSYWVRFTISQISLKD